VTEALAGPRVMVPVTPSRGGLAELVARAGAVPEEVEFIEIAPTSDPAALERAAREWCEGRFDWMAVTSRNAVLAMSAEAKAASSWLSAAVPPARIAAVGQATRAVCASVGLPVSLIPATATALGLVADFPQGPGRVLVPLGDKASNVLVTGLSRKGWDVTAVESYRTVAGPGPTAHQVEALAAGEIDAVLLTSGSMAAHLASACPHIHDSTRMVAIGATTAAAAIAVGLTVNAIADEPTYDALVAAWERSTGRTAP